MQRRPRRWPRLAQLDALLTALYVLVDVSSSSGPGVGRRSPTPRYYARDRADLPGLPVGAAVLAVRAQRSDICSVHPQPARLQQRLRKLAPAICEYRPLGAQLAVVLRPAAAHRLYPGPCGASRETVKRSELAGLCPYGYCASHSRYFWGLRLYLLCAPDGMPIAFCLAPANEPQREIAAALLERAARGELLHGHEIFITDKGFAGNEFEQFITDALGAQLVRPDRKDEPPRFGALGGIRQWIESVNDTLKGQFSLERHGGHTPEGVWTRVCQRVLALAAGCWQNRPVGQPGRGFTAYDH